MANRARDLAGNPNITQYAALGAWEESVAGLSCSVRDYLATADALFGHRWTPAGPQTSTECKISSDVETPPASLEIEATLGNLRRLEESLQLGCTALKRVCNHSLPLTPINHLPFDCLSAIFAIESEQAHATWHDLWLEDPKVGMEERSRPSPPSFCFSVSQVCRQWRAVALRTPQLWTHISSMDHTPPQATPFFLKRSKNAALTIAISPPLDAIDPPLDLDGRALVSRLPLLRPHISRCTHLIILAIRREPLDIFAPLSEFLDIQPSHRLRALSLTSVDQDDESILPEDEEMRPFEDLMQGLSTLRLKGVCLPWGSLAYTCLVTLTLFNITEDRRPTSLEFEAVMRNCPLLEYLALGYIGYYYEADDDDETPVAPTALPSSIMMSSLCTVKLVQVEAAMLLQLFDAIAAPILETFIVDGMEDSYEIPLHPATNHDSGDSDASDASGASDAFDAAEVFFSPSLGIQSGWDEEADPLVAPLIVLLSKFPSISTLRLSNLEHIDDIISAMAYRDLCPRLRGLSLYNCEGSVLFGYINDLAERNEDSHSSGGAIQRLTITDCFSDVDASLSRVPELVPDFEFKSM
ncbi:hypothetical protein BOTBODRAFT_176662 [Botryobasidium botryosum FD-172 SS1]|uniref:Uncharacterized protein n=1 Tax=Botryobasidium botryosum (strain FD-172 SS1) TaxID=930990 RepID=A0A067M8N0_BOTB1|nr:hypothetical protein BOTBODRAFT_176662 [Botryobasidium botryosum FD-172 SS1]